MALRMRKRITQETFDQAVKENVEDLEMELDEAIEDAVETFEAQGVDLSNIVREGAAGGNPVLARATRIKEMAEKGSAGDTGWSLPAEEEAPCAQ